MLNFLMFFCAGWQVCWNRHSSPADYIIYLSGELFIVVFSASGICFLKISFFVLSDDFYRYWWLNAVGWFLCVFFCLCYRTEVLTYFILIMFCGFFFGQYLKHFKILHYHFFELFPILFGVAIVWVYATILTVAGTYDHASALGQIHCRTDRSGLVSTAPW
jgi:hypothetical protein